jgi:CRP-like cAMP-binding protein
MLRIAAQDGQPAGATSVATPPGNVLSPQAQVLIRRRLCLNHELTHQEQRAIVDALEVGPTLDAGAAIAGAAPRLIVLTAGLATASVAAPSDERRIVAIYVPGDIVNLSSFMSKHVGPALAAASECELAVLPAEKVAHLITDFSGIHQSLLRQLGLEMAILRKWMEPRKPSEAIAHLYCELYTRHRLVGLVQNGEALSLPLTQHHLAEALGASLVHTNKSARTLKRQGWLAFGGHHKILDIDSLAEHAKFSPDYLGVC